MNSRYLLGIPEMDEQHRRILDLANMAKAGVTIEFEINSILIRLIEYSLEHLDSEENFLLEAGLVDLEKNHSVLHVEFRSRAMDYYNRFRTLDSFDEKRSLLAEIGEFCERWLLEHIDVEDRRYAEILLGRRPHENS